tara:strand:+ start:352 stop:663 length:312 start_codon:yes stop_codon:yes gene_type:complete
MSLSDHFFKGKCCVCSIRYFLSWFFFLSSIGVTIAILLINPKHIDYGNVPLTVRVLFFITIAFIVGIISRFMCYLNSKDNIQKLNISQNNVWYSNQLMYEEDV